MPEDEIARQERARELREEIERLRSGEGSEGPPKSPREFVQRAASEEADTMAERRIGTREEWQAAREELAKLEGEQAERNEEIKKKRRELPWVPVEKEYEFDTCLLYTSPSPRDGLLSRMPSSA